MRKTNPLLQVTILLILITVLTGSLSAQKTMADLAKLSTKKLAKFVRIEKTPKEKKSNYGSVPHLSKLSGSPQRVGLLSFYIYDPGTKKVIHGGIYDAMGGYTITALTKDGASLYAAKFYNEGFEYFQKSMNDRNFGVLTPAEYLNTKEKFDYYNEFTPKLSIFSKFAMSFMNAFTKAAGRGVIDVSATAPGYRLLKLPLQDPKLTKSLYDLMIKLDLDAVIVMENTVKSDKKKFYLTGISMTMFGVNPVPREPGKKYPGWSYQDCLEYGKATMNFKNPVMFAKYNKKASKKSNRRVYDEDYSGYSQAVSVLTDEFGDYLNRRIAGKNK